METTGKIILGTAIGVGAIAAISYAKSIGRAQAQLQIIPNVRIHKLAMDGLTLRIDALLKNPTQASFKIKFPFIEIIHNGVLIGSSQVINKDINIPPFGQVMIEGMMVNVSVISLATSVYDIIRGLLNNVPVTFTVGVITTVILGWTSVAYEHKQDFTLKR